VLLAPPRSAQRPPFPARFIFHLYIPGLGLGIQSGALMLTQIAIQIIGLRESQQREREMLSWRRILG
jgi:hypothetical protein